MKRLFKYVGAFVACLSLFLMVACSNVSQSYADKINNAASDKEPIALEQVRKDLGDERVEILVLESGVVISVKGCKTMDDLKKKLDEEDNVEGIVITIALGKATHAEYRKINTSDLK